MFLHFSQFAVAGFLAPILIWQMRKTDMLALEAHGKVVVNWIISELIYATICFFFVFALIRIPPLVLLAILGVVFPILAASKQTMGYCGDTLSPSVS